MGSTVEYSSTVETTLTCPDVRRPTRPIRPIRRCRRTRRTRPFRPSRRTPIPPAPVVPGQPERARCGVSRRFARPPRGRHGRRGRARELATYGRCLARLPRIRLHGRHFSRVTVFVDGRQVRARRGRPLQRLLTVRRLGSLAPGPHRVTVRVRFRLGSGSRPLTLERRVRICARRAAALHGLSRWRQRAASQRWAPASRWPAPAARRVRAGSGPPTQRVRSGTSGSRTNAP